MKCTGSDTIPSSPGAISEIPCPKCGYEIEFFNDDKRRKCRKCSEIVVNPNTEQGTNTALKK